MLTSVMEASNKCIVSLAPNHLVGDSKLAGTKSLHVVVLFSFGKFKSIFNADCCKAHYINAV